jgi:hypothetical protein
MVIVVPSHHLIDRFQDFQGNAGEITDLSGTPEGLKLASTTGQSRIQTIVFGQVMDDLPQAVASMTNLLEFATRVIKASPGGESVVEEKYVAIDIQENSINFLALGDPFFLVSIPVLGNGRAGIEVPVLEGPFIKLCILEDNEKMLKELVHRPSGRDVEKALVQLCIDHDRLTMIAFYGRIMSEFRMDVQATGHMQLEFPLQTFTQLVRVGFFAPGSLSIGQENHLTRFERGATIQIAPSVEHVDLTEVLHDLEMALASNHAIISRDNLFEVASSVATSPDVKLEVFLECTGGYVTLWNAEKKIVEREISGEPLDSQSKWTMGRSLNSRKYHVEQPVSFIVRAQDLVNGLKILSSSAHILIATCDPNPAYIVIRDEEIPFPRIMVATAFKLGEINR